MRKWLILMGSMLGFSVQASALPPVDELLELRDQARACYLGFIKIYDVDYLADDASTRCVRVSYLRGFSADELGEATTKVFAKRHGNAEAARFIDLLDGVNQSYKAVQDGDTYTYCVADTAGGVLIRDGEPVKRISSDEFARRFLQIWVNGERADGMPEWSFNNC
jgi:hypothetical protein